MADKKLSQSDRLLAFLKRRGRDGATSMDVIHALGIVNVTGRISDLRKGGVDVLCRHEGGRYIFYLDQPPPIAQLAFDGTERALL